MVGKGLIGVQRVNTQIHKQFEVQYLCILSEQKVKSLNQVTFV